MDNFVNEIESQHSKVGDTPQNYGECVGLTEVYFDRLGKNHIWGNAIDMLANAPRDQFQVTYNSADGQPAPQPHPVAGDAIVFHANYGAGLGTGSAGHVSLFFDGDIDSHFRSFDQNFPTGTFPHIQNHTYRGVAGWIHPYTPAPVAVVVPEVIITPAPIVEVIPTPEVVPVIVPVVVPPVVEAPVVMAAPLAPEPVVTAIVVAPVTAPNLGLATLGTMAIVRDLATGKDIAKVRPQTLTIATTKIVAGTLYLVTKGMVEAGLDHGINSQYFVKKVDAITPPETPQLNFVEEVTRELSAIEKFITKIIHRS